MYMPDLSRAHWRKSSFSQANGSCVEIAYVPAEWRTSSFSQGNGSCVEVAHGELAVGVRDTKDRSGPALLVEPAAFTAFLRTIVS